MALALAIMTTAFAGCGGGGSASSSAASSAASGTASQAPASKTLSVCMGPEPDSIDPALNTAIDASNYIYHAFEGLTKLDKDGVTIVNAEAKDIKESSDGKTYTITLRDDLKWSDGQPVKASDYVYAWQRVVDPKTGSEYNYIMDPVLNATDIYTGKNKDVTALGVKAVDDKTLEVKLASPTAYFKQLLSFAAFFPVRKDTIEKNGDKWTQDPKTYITNGAYMMKSWDHKDNLTFVKNPNYYDKDKITNDTIKFVLLEDDAAQLAAYQNNELSFIDSMPTEEIQAWTSKPDYHKIPRLGTTYTYMSTITKPFDNVKVRQAFSLAVDREYLATKAVKPALNPLTGFVPSGVSDADASQEFRKVGGDFFATSAADYEKNVAKAKQLLAEAGYPDGKGFPAVEYLYNEGGNNKAIAEGLQNMWKTALNVNVTLTAQEWKVLIKTRNSGAYQLARGGWVADYNDPMTFMDIFVTGGGNNDAKWSNKDYDALIQKAKSTDDQKVRMQAMHDAEKILIDQSPIIPMMSDQDIYLQNENLKGVYTSPLGFKFFYYATQE